MNVKEKANDLILKLQSKKNAMICMDEILDDLKTSFSIAQDLHPHAEGLISGSISFWTEVKLNLK